MEENFPAYLRWIISNRQKVSAGMCTARLLIWVLRRMEHYSMVSWVLPQDFVAPAHPVFLGARNFRDPTIPYLPTSRERLPTVLQRGMRSIFWDCTSTTGSISILISGGRTSARSRISEASHSPIADFSRTAT